MTLLKGNDYKEINVALLSLEADIKNKITGFDTSVIDRQLAEINSRIDKINAGGNNPSAAINDIRTEIEDINYKLNVNSAKIENIEQKLTDIFSAENKVTDFNTTTDSGIYYWIDDAANKPGANYGVLLVNKYDGGGNLWISQIAYGTNNKIYFRQYINSGNWTEWKAVAFDGEVTAATILDYVRGTPIKVRWGGPGIDSAEWYPAFNADGSALEPISRTNIHAGTADSANNGTFGMLGGTKQSETVNFEDLLNNELCSNQTGGLRGGSIHIPEGQEANNLGIPVSAWYNFLYIPHRTGFNDIGSYSDNNMYGTLFVTPMTSNDGTLYIIHRISGHNYPAHRFNSVT